MTYHSVKLLLCFRRENRREAATKALLRAKGFIRSELGKRLSTRKVPDLIFEIDESIEYGNKIDMM